MNKSIFLLIMVFVNSVVAQVNSGPVRIDEFTRRNCEETKARIDYFMNQLSNRPSERGVIVIHGKSNDLRGNLIYEEMLKGVFLVRRYDPKGITFVRTGYEPELRVEEWIMPSDSSWAPDDVHDWDLIIKPPAKPFIVHSEYGFGDDICPPVDSVKMFGELLKVNERSRGTIVVRSGSDLLSKKAQRELIRVLARKYNIPNERIRFRYAKRTQPRLTWNEPDTEFWFLPH